MDRHGIDAAPPRRSLRHGTRAERVHGSAAGAEPTTAGESVDAPKLGGELPAAQARFLRADCKPLPRNGWVLLAAGLLVVGLCGLCVLCGSSLLLQKQDNHGEHRDHRAEQTEERQQGDRQLRCAV
jgi:hypothetical protein